MRLEDLGGTLKTLDDVYRLVLHLESEVDVPGHHGHPPRIHPLRHVDGFSDVIQKVLPGVLPARREHRLIPPDLVRDEDSHTHAEALHLPPDPLLDISRPSLHPVVLEGAKAYVGHELDLVDEIIARVRGEHAEVRGIVER